ncbi:MAG TPA: hypothetical protein VEU62_10185 [Bryobacterales bacterium]|nr:hypothetical protein [Bryobacterales bacterium]
MFRKAERFLEESASRIQLPHPRLGSCPSYAKADPNLWGIQIRRNVSIENLERIRGPSKRDEDL